MTARGPNVQALCLTGYIPRRLPVPFAEISRLRADLITATVRSFRPDLLLGDHTDANGFFSTTVPTGAWNVLVDPQEGSFAAPLTVNNVTVAGATTLNRTLGPKQLRLTASSYGIPTLPQGGPLPIDTTFHNLTAGTLATLIDIVVQLPSGTEIPVFPTIPLDVPPVQLPLSGILFPLPAVPAGETGKPLKFLVRFRAAGNGTILDSASTEFVIQ